MQGYPATITNNDDSNHPDGKKRQRGQLRIPQIHRNVPDNQLPYAMPQHQGQRNAGGGVGNVDVPPNGAKVMVNYDEEDPHTLYYGGSPSTDDVQEKNELLKEDYPHTKGHIDHGGNKYSVNTKKDKETITDTHKKGTTIHRDKDGNMMLYAPKDLILSAKGSIKLASKGDMQMHASGKSSLKGSRIDMNGSDDKTDPITVGERGRPDIPSSSGKTSL